MKRVRLLFPVIVFSSLIAVPAASAAPAIREPAIRQVDAAARGELVDAAGAASRAELVDFGEDLASSLLKVPPQEKVRLTGWPVAPEERADVLLTRHDVYAPDARIWKVGKGGLTEVPRSRLAFFWGTAEGDEETRVFVSVDPDTQTFAGFSQTARAVHEVHPLKDVEPAARGSLRHVVAPPEFFLEKVGETPEWSCGQTGAPLGFLQQETAESSTGSLFEAAITSLHTATIAVDTDNELMANKFGNNTTTASNYIASLFAAMNVIYERDLLVRLVQGNTFLRVSTTADPYVQTGSDSFAKLNEFTTYWRNNYSGINRALAMMLSGKGGSGASGIAWIDALCSQSYGYSFTQVYTSGTGVSFGDTLVAAHEIGHNFGSPHTHCYNLIGLQLPDSCYSGDTYSGQSCFSGTRSCPAPATYNGVANVTGTLMSYCHTFGGCSSSLVFHPITAGLLNPKVQARVNTCIFPAAPPPPPAPTVSAVSPASGSTTGGTPVTITGANFAPGASVTFGGAAATAVVVVNSTTITAVTPARATGAVTVAVTNPSAQSGSKSSAYFYAPPPAVSDFYTLIPCRVLDTRNPNGPLGGPALGASGQRTFDVTGTCGIPNAAKAISVNVTIVGPTAAGYLGIFPGNAFPMGTNSGVFEAGLTCSNNAILTLATDGSGTIGILNGSAGSAHVLVDVNGYFQ